MGTYLTDATQWVEASSGLHVPFGGVALPPPVANKIIGIYQSGNNTSPDLDTTTAGWPTQPNLASFYFNWGSNFSNNTKLLEYSGQDRVLLVAFLQKVTGGGFVLWDEMASGSQDAAIITMLGYLNALSASRIIVTLDNEPDNGNTSAHPSSQTAAEYKAAAERFFGLVADNTDVHVEPGLHFAGGNTTLVKSMMPTAAKITNLGWDPYKTGSHAVSETPTQLFQSFINNVIVPLGLEDKSRHIMETGIKTDTFSNGGSFTVATQEQFYTDIPAGMDANQIESVLWFRADSGQHNYIPTDPAVDQAFETMLDGALAA